jgi:hypothetical protein
VRQECSDRTDNNNKNGEGEGEEGKPVLAGNGNSRRGRQAAVGDGQAIISSCTVFLVVSIFVLGTQY